MKIKNFYKFGKNYLKKKEKNIMGCPVINVAS